VQSNFQSSNHKGLDPRPGPVGTNTTNTWEPFPVPYLLTLWHAILLLELRLIKNSDVLMRCDAAFQGLRYGRTFSDVYRDPAVWVSYNSNELLGLHVLTVNKEISISKYCFRPDGSWNMNPVVTIAATLVHELAHVAGATSKQEEIAEGILNMCNFDDVYNQGNQF
jgi:hypothetical protein